jgi:hypothetical protein
MSGILRSETFTTCSDITPHEINAIFLDWLTDTRLQLGEEEIEEVKEFAYLGSIISKGGGSDKDITARIKKAKATFHNYHPFGNQSKSL